MNDEAKRTYRGCMLIRTVCCRFVTRVAFGRPYRAIVRIWNVQGRLCSPVWGQQWLTSAAECREWIRTRDAEAERAGGNTK